MMAAGLDRQLTFCDASNATVDFISTPAVAPSWCQDEKLVSDLQSARTRLWNSINGAPEGMSKFRSHPHHINIGCREVQ